MPNYNPTYDLRGKRIDNTYQQIIQYNPSSGLSYDGQGNQLGLTSSYSLFSNTTGLISSSISSSWSKTSSYSPIQLPDLSDNTSIHVVTVDGQISGPGNAWYINTYFVNSQPLGVIGGSNNLCLLTDDARNDMFVGVNNITPGYSLDVNGDINFSSNLYQNGLIYIPPTSSYSLSSSYALTASYIPSFTDITDNGLGMVGINQINPQYALDVSGSIGDSVSGNFLISGNGGNSFINGNLGIGTNTPNWTLDVNGIIGNSSTSSPNYINLCDLNGNFILYTNKNIGINQTFPQYTLDVNGPIGNSTIAAGANLVFSSSAYYIGWTQGNNILFQPGGDSLHLGMVGINQPSPTSMLDVGGSINFTGQLLNNQKIYTASYASVSSMSLVTQTIANRTYNFNLSLGNSGNQPVYLSTNLQFNPSTNILSAGAGGLYIQATNITASLLGTSSYSNTSSFENGLFSNYTLQTSSYTISSTDFIVIFSGSSALSCSLSTPVAGRVIKIKNVSPYLLTVTSSYLIDNSYNWSINQWSSMEIGASTNQYYIL